MLDAFQEGQLLDGRAGQCLCKLSEIQEERGLWQGGSVPRLAGAQPTFPPYWAEGATVAGEPVWLLMQRAEQVRLRDTDSWLSSGPRTGFDK